MENVNEDKNAGLRKIIRQGKQMFSIPENTDHYSAENYRLAEKKFIKWCVLEGKC
jgi:hypothetical protein